jgi:hypothetical protein
MKIVQFVLLAAMLAVLPNLATAQANFSYNTINGGGGVASNGSQSIIGTIGQPDAAPNGQNGATTLNNGFWFGGPATALFVEIKYIKAISKGVGEPVDIEWATALEVDNAGFHLYRSEPNGAGHMKGERISNTLIPAMGEGSGATYFFTDLVPIVTIDENRGYYLEDIDINGLRNLNGPFFVEIEPDGFIPASVTTWEEY